MIRFTLAAIIPLGLFCGCAEQTDDSVASPDSTANSSMLSSDDSLGTPTDGLSTSPEDSSTSNDTAAATAEDVALTPANTKITFVGIHTNKEKPDPRSGRFEAFTGNAIVTGGQLTSLKVDIETASIATDFDKLTDHLKSNDFFDVREKPTAAFQSTKIDTGDDGTVTVTGDLTLLGVTKSISFPANVSTDGGLKLTAEFTIDRSEFGMDFGLDNVEKDVSMNVSIGG